MKTYSDLSKDALIERIHALELQIQQNKREESRHARTMEELSLHQEELRVQNEELKATQTRIEKIQKKYYDLYEFAPVGYITLSTSAIIKEVNLTFCRMLDLSRTDILDKTLILFVTPAFRSLVSQIPKAVAKNRTYSVKLCMEVHGRKPIWVQLNSVLNTGDQAKAPRINVTVIDITRLVETEKRLAATNDFLQMIMDNLPTTMVILDSKGVIEKINHSWQLFARENDLACENNGVGCNYIDICRRTPKGSDEFIQSQTVAKALTDLINGRRKDYQMEYPCHSPTEKRWFQLCATRFVIDNEMKLILTHTSITERKLLEMQISEDRDRYSDILSALNTGLRLIERDMTISWVNPHFLDMFPGFDPIGKRCYETFNQEHHCVDCGAQRAFTTKTFQQKDRYFPDFKKWYAIFSAPIMDENGKVSRVIEGVTDITEKKRSDEIMRQKEARYRALFENNSVPMFLVEPATGKLIDVNKAAAAKYGWSRERMKTMSVHDINPLSSDELAKEISDSRSEGKKIFHFKHRHANGDIRDVEVFSGPIMIEGRKILHSTIIDVTERKEAERELLRLRRSVENSFASIVITDPDGVIQYANPAFYRVTGFTEGEVIGNSTSLLRSGIHEDDFYAAMWRMIQKGHTWRGEICNQKKNGDLYWEQASISPVKDREGRITNFIAVKDDISDRKELERLQQDVERIMRHDLKTPLNGIIGLPQVIKMEDNLTAEQQELLDAIYVSGQRMLRMIDSSMDLFNMETGIYSYSPETVDVIIVIKTLIKDMKPRWAARQVEISLESVPDNALSSFSLLGERDLMYNMLSNLLINAIEASPESETVTIQVVQEPIPMIAITNQGAVPEPIRKRFFMKYNTYGKKGGTGIGTYSAKLMADTMGYQLHMDTSDEENVTRLTIVPAEESVKGKSDGGTGNSHSPAT
ncbi:MAG TPA: PAS domain S-box protein [Desulfobacteraceae bacterium]|nr:PAS domain S-box protein [Desulfobacteraceae bacterium]